MLMEHLIRLLVKVSLFMSWVLKPLVLQILVLMQIYTQRLQLQHLVV